MRCVVFTLWYFIPWHQCSRVVTVQNTDYTLLLVVYSASTPVDKLNNSNHSTNSYWIHHSYWLSWQLRLHNWQYFLCRWCSGKAKVGIWLIHVHTNICHLRIIYCQWTWLKKFTQVTTVSPSLNPSSTSTGSMAHAGPRATTWLISGFLYPQLFFSSLYHPFSSDHFQHIQPSLSWLSIGPSPFLDTSDNITDLYSGDTLSISARTQLFMAFLISPD